MKSTLVSLIDCYKKYISPRKGFSCAHRIYHGGDSCSTFVRDAIQIHGVIGSIKPSVGRFKACSVAAKKINQERHKPAKKDPGKKRDDKDADDIFKCCLLELISNGISCLFF